MRRYLSGPSTQLRLPPAYALCGFADADAAAVHSLLVEGYADGGGEVGALNQWWPALQSDTEFSTDLCLLVRYEDRQIVAVAQSWTSDFIKDVVVHPAHRRRGLGEALLAEVFSRFASRGATQVDLKVQADNAAAIALYKKVGMVEVEA